MSTIRLSLIRAFPVLLFLLLAPTAASAQAAPTISISSPVPYQVIQRNDLGRADITVAGTYSGNASGIEASWKGGPFVPLTVSADGTYAGVIPNQRQGQGPLTVRFADLSAEAKAGAVGIGDIFVIAGQSNAVGHGVEMMSYTSTDLKASLFGNDDKWKILKDPTDDPTNQIDAVSVNNGGGSVYPLIATYFLAKERVPIAFVPAAKGSTSIQQWQRDAANPGNTATLYGSMHRRINAVGGKVKAVLFWHGESGINSNMTREMYASRLDAIVDGIYEDFGTVTVVAQVGDYNISLPDLNFDRTRLAQEDVWSGNAHARQGPLLYDIALADMVHFTQTTELEIAAKRWWAALCANFYGCADGFGPVATSVEYNKARNGLRVTFSDATLPLLPTRDIGGFTVKNDGIEVPIVRVTRVLDNELSIALQSAATGIISVSFATGRSGNGVNVPTDSSAYKLPAHPFFDWVATPYTP